MRICISFVFFLLFVCFSSDSGAQNPSSIDYVNTLMETDSKFSLSNGNTYPAIALPWGMNFWTQQTAKMGDAGVYAYDAYKIWGFKQTHQPSSWINDYGQFSIFPETGKLKIAGKSHASWFSHKAETAKPYYCSVYLADYDVVTEITPTERAAMFDQTELFCLVIFSLTIELLKHISCNAPNFEILAIDLLSRIYFKISDSIGSLMIITRYSLTSNLTIVKNIPYVMMQIIIQ